MRAAIIVLAAAVLGLAGCREKRAEDQQAMPGMRGIQGMAMRSDSLMPLIRAHLDSMAALSPQFAAGMLPAHDAMMSRMLDAMGADMTGMGMKPDSAWTALTDSIGRDLADLPALSGRSLDARLTVHIERMRRLMTMHDRIMRAMMQR